jgi:hypothetical protein
MYDFAPLGRTRTPNPGKSASHIVSSLITGWMESMRRFEIRRLVILPLLGSTREALAKNFPECCGK